MAAPTDDSGDVPPLEDMTDLLNHVERVKLEREKVSPRNTYPAAVATALPDTEPIQVEQQKPKVPPKSGDANATSGFAGMKKGFLFGSNSTTSRKKPVAQKKPLAAQSDDGDIPFIKPKEDANKQHAFPEVQEAMKANRSFLQNKDWITGDLLEEVEKNPDLLQKMADPTFSQALAMFQSDPQRAMKEYGSNPEVQKFFVEFSSILGNHFSSLADKDSQSSFDGKEGRGAGISEARNQTTVQEDRQVQEILNNPEIKEILLDPEIQQLIATLRTEPEKGQRMAQNAKPATREKLQKLIKAGVLGVQ